jgi:hypothetical protein
VGIGRAILVIMIERRTLLTIRVSRAKERQSQAKTAVRGGVSVEVTSFLCFGFVRPHKTEMSYWHSQCTIMRAQTHEAARCPPRVMGVMQWEYGKFWDSVINFLITAQSQWAETLRLEEATKRERPEGT